MSSSAQASQSTQLDTVLRSGIAGGTAGCVAKTVVAPLDRVKILFQTSNPDFQKYSGSWSGVYRAGKEIYVTAGLRGLFQGHSATLIRVFPYAGINFMAYDEIRRFIIPRREAETNFRRFAAGALAGVTSVFFTYPLELIRVRMAFQTRTYGKTDVRPSFTSAFREIYHEHARTPTSAKSLLNKFPLFKFYRGFTVTTVGIIPYGGTSFLTWDFLRSKLLPRTPSGKKQSHPVADLAMGAVAGATSQTASYPFEVIRRRMQVGGVTQPDRWLRWGETIRTIWQTHGWRGFYVGLSIGYLKIVPMKAVSFTMWQVGKRILGID
ncbi:mitochondrial carrier [Fistulina hepatica ATCC 64428]|uniref:Mitochondrial carrier n=1 Tax=Fistulina hepatica ATCC 64428 TaxID=1128425 RepID=A0A0D7AT50_9AGAR|nr:mitochondrial carrier [Fistulina hepatica ATCC 64428]